MRSVDFSGSSARSSGGVTPPFPRTTEVLPVPVANANPPLPLRLHEVQYETRSFEVDVLVCVCGAERAVLACITDRTAARRILQHLGLPDEPPTSTPPRAPPGLD